MENEAQVDRQGRQQVDNAEEAEDVFPGLPEAIDAGQVFDGEKERQQVFECPEHQIGGVREDMHALENDKHNAQDNAGDQDQVEQFPAWRVRFEHDGVDFLLQLVVMQEVGPPLAEF